MDCVWRSFVTVWLVGAKSEGPFLDRLGNFSGSKVNFKIKSC